MSVTQDTLKDSDLINWTIFQELLLMDEDEEGFALSLVETFVQQANDTFEQIDEIFEKEHNKDELLKLSSLGHYIKGSAAALGLQKVQDECEKIQNFGKMECDDEEIDVKALQVEDWYDLCEKSYSEMKIYFKESMDLLAQYFDAEL